MTQGVYEHRQLNPERDRQILVHLASGLKPTEIAKMMGFKDRNIVCSVRHRYGHTIEIPKREPDARYLEQQKCAAPPKPTGNIKCQWLTGEPRHRKFCNKPGVSHKTPWCSEHYGRVFLKRRDAA